VAPDSAAYQSGLRPGDVIIRADKQNIHSPEDLTVYLRSSQNWRGKKDLSLSVIHANAATVTELPPFEPRTLGLYPTQLYESTSMILLFLLLLAYEPFRRHEGQLMALVMIGYAVHRYLNELLRDDPRPKGFEFYVSLLFLILGVALWLWLQLKPAQTKAVVPAQPVAAGV
jgi:prolipoprotein diacylglyceryltransferase